MGILPFPISTYSTAVLSRRHCSPRIITLMLHTLYNRLCKNSIILSPSWTSLYTISEIFQFWVLKYFAITVHDGARKNRIVRIRITFKNGGESKFLARSRKALIFARVTSHGRRATCHRSLSEKNTTARRDILLFEQCEIKAKTKLAYRQWSKNHSSLWFFHAPIFEFVFGLKIFLWDVFWQNVL